MTSSTSIDYQIWTNVNVLSSRVYQTEKMTIFTKTVFCVNVFVLDIKKRYGLHRVRFVKAHRMIRFTLDGLKRPEIWPRVKINFWPGKAMAYIGRCVLWDKHIDIHFVSILTGSRIFLPNKRLPTSDDLEWPLEGLQAKYWTMIIKIRPNYNDPSPNQTDPMSDMEMRSISLLSHWLIMLMSQKMT